MAGGYSSGITGRPRTEDVLVNKGKRKNRPIKLSGGQQSAIVIDDIFPAVIGIGDGLR